MTSFNSLADLRCNVFLVLPARMTCVRMPTVPFDKLRFFFVMFRDSMRFLGLFFNAKVAGLRQCDM